MYLKSKGYRTFLLVNYLMVTLIALLCLFPLIHVLSMSFSSSWAAKAGLVTLWPIDFTLKSYVYILTEKQFVASFVTSVQRVILGASINIILTLMIAYPLSKEPRDFPQRTLYAWLFMFTMIFQGGLIPTYLVVKEAGLLNSIWSLVLPTAVPIFNVLLMLNFFRSLPKELEEAGHIDGAGHVRTLWSIYLPISLPGIATVSLIAIVMHWNAWFDGLIFLNKPEHYPLATFLRMQLMKLMVPQMNVTLEDAIVLASVSDRTARSAQIFIAAVPILVLYPFLQKYFVQGLVLGSVKG